MGELRKGPIRVSRNRAPGKLKLARYGNGTWLLWLGPLFIERWMTRSGALEDTDREERG